MALNEIQSALCENSPSSFDGLRAILFNTSLKTNPEESHTKLLLNVVGEILERNAVEVEHVHMASRDVAFGIYPDMTEHGANSDEWPEIWTSVDAADIIVIGTPLWLGEESSICRVLIERLYAMSGLLNNRGRAFFTIRWAVVW